MTKHGTMTRYFSKKTLCRCQLCTKAASEYQKKRRLNRPDITARNRELALAYRRKLIEHMKLIKNNPCTDCGIKYPYYVMHFDHLDKKTKIAGIAQLQSIARINEEVKKCELVCANCHAERTQKRLISKGAV